MVSHDTSLLSVIIPIKNINRNRPYLLITLQKIAPLPINVILSFDINSEDSELNSFLDEIRDSHQRPLQILVEECNSPGLARNRALQGLQTDWVAFWDSDDLPNPESVMNLIHETMSKGKVVGVGKFEIKSSDSSNQTFLSQQVWSEKPFIDIALNPGIWRFVFSTTRITNTLFPAMLMGEDQIFLARLNLHQEEMNFSELITYIYLKHPSGQLTNSKSSIQEIIYASRLLNSELISVKDSPLNVLLFSNQILTGLFRTNLKTKFSYLKLLIEVSFEGPEKTKKVMNGLLKLLSRKISNNG